MKDYEVMDGKFENNEIFSDVNFGMGDIFISCIFLYIVHSSPFLCVCGDDRITYYPGADDLTGGPGDA